MSFTGNTITIAGLIKIDLPGKTLRICDGGQVIWGTETYLGEDAEFGSIDSVQPVRDALGDSAPGGQISFIPKSDTAAATLNQAGFQGSRMRFYQAEVDQNTGVVIGTPEFLFDGILDVTTLHSGLKSRVLDMAFISRADRLFLVNEGNSLSPRFHSTLFPGEIGFDNATGASLTVAWGIDSPPRGSVSSSGSAGYYGGGYDYNNFSLNFSGL